MFDVKYSKLGRPLGLFMVTVLLVLVQVVFEHSPFTAVIFLTVKITCISIVVTVKMMGTSVVLPVIQS